MIPHFVHAPAVTPYALAAQTAACAAVADHACMRATCRKATGAGDSLAARLRTLGFDVADLFTNFDFIRISCAEVAPYTNKAQQAEGAILRRQDAAATLLARWAKDTQI